MKLNGPCYELLYIYYRIALSIPMVYNREEEDAKNGNFTGSIILLFKLQREYKILAHNIRRGV